MINLPILRQNDREILKDIIQSKHKPAKTSLLNKYENILGDYLEYYKNRHSLERITADIDIDEEVSKYLNDAYKSGKVIDSVKAKITEIMPPAIKEKCPYCMLSEPGTFDHYLGKGQFPEYSVLSKNLVPCCSKCNSKKGEKFLSANGNRIFISFYFDELPKSSFLIVELDIDGDVPYIKDIYINSNFSVKISIPLENTGVSSVFATSVWPFSLIFSLARRNEGNFFQAVPTTLSSSLAEVRLASLVAWA